MTITHHKPAGLSPGPGYSHAVSGTGRMVFLAGQVSLDGNGATVGSGDVVAQAEQVFKNIGLALGAAGAAFEDLVKLNYYLLDIGALPAIRAVRDRYVDTARPPASTAVEVKALARPDLLIEIEALALVGDSE